MASMILNEVMKKLILAEKKISNIETIHAIQERRLQPIIPSAILPAAKSPVFQQIKKLPLAPIDLGKLNTLILNPAVSAIECSGSGKPVSIKQENQMIETNVILNESEITDIINKFSRVSGIPVTPIMKAAYNQLTINAFVFPSLGNKFFILKR